MSTSFIVSETREISTGRPIDLLAWGRMNLSETDYARLVAAQARQDNLVDNAGVEFEEVYETVFSNILQSNITVAIGAKLSFPNGVPAADPEWHSFHTMFVNHPDISYIEINQ